MATVNEFAELKIKVDASELTKLDKDIDQSKKKIGDLGDTASKSGGGLGSLGSAAEGAGAGLGTFAVAAGAAAVAVGFVVTKVADSIGWFVDLGKTALDVSDKLNDFSEQTLISTTRLNYLTNAYKLTGVTAKEVIDNAEALSGKLAKQDEATGKVVMAMEKLGVSTKDANGEQKTALQLQEDIVVAASKAKDASEGHALAVAALGTSYYKLRQPILDVKEKGEAMYDLMVKTGGYISGDMSKASGELHDNLDRLKVVFGGIGTTIAKVALPALNAVASKVLEVATAVAQAISRIAGTNPANEKVGAALGDLQKQLDVKQASVAKLMTKSEAELTAQQAKTLAQDKEAVAVLQERIREMSRYKVAADQAAAAQKKLDLQGTPGEGQSTASARDPKPSKGSKEKAEKEPKTLSDIDIYKKQQAALEDFRKSEEELANWEKSEREKAAKQEEHMHKLLEHRAELYKGYIDQNYEVMKQLAEVNTLEEKGLLTTEEAIKARQKLNDERAPETFAEGWSSAMKKFSKDAQDSAKAGEDAFNSFANNVEGALNNFIQTGKFSFSDFARSVIADLGKMAAKAAASGIANLLSGAIGSALGSGTNWASNGSGFGTGSNFGNMDFGGFFADGGDPPVGKMSVVGENGPEVFVPKTAGTIIPNSALSGGNLNVGGITINVQGGQTNEETGNVINAKLLKTLNGLVDQRISHGMRRGNSLNPL